MTTTDPRAPGPRFRHGQIGYLQLPALDVSASAAFYRAVFDWTVDGAGPEFEAPGMIGQWTTERSPAAGSGPVVWVWVDQLGPTLQRVAASGGRVRSAPELDGGERWLVEIDDPAGNRIGVVTHATAPEPQTLLAVRDVEKSSGWYQQLLGLRSDHGGPNYERLVTSAGRLVLQLHRWDVEHDHGRIGDPDRDVGNGVLVWFGEVSDFDGVVARAEEIGASTVLPSRRNPPEGGGNGPAHREIWLQDPDGYTVVVASPDGEAWALLGDQSTARAT